MTSPFSYLDHKRFFRELIVLTQAGLVNIFLLVAYLHESLLVRENGQARGLQLLKLISAVGLLDVSALRSD